MALDVNLDKEFLERGIAELDQARRFTAGLLKRLG